MLFLYNLLLFFTTPLWLLYLARHPRTRGTLGPRLGFIRVPPQARGGVWLHAVSVGELAAATPLLTRLLEKKTPVVLTTATRAAQEVALKKYATQPTVFVTYLPVDAPWVLRRFFSRAQPSRVVIFETELWPNLLTMAVKRGVRCFWFNGRVSDRMMAQKGFVRALNLLALRQFEAISMLSTEQQQRLLTFFDPGPRLAKAGQSKLDVSPPPCPADVAELLNRWKGECRVVLLAGSTHEPEEEILLHLATNQRQWENTCHVVLAPRHGERVPAVVELAKKMGFVTGLRSEAGQFPPLGENQRACLVVDTTGELASLYEAADVAFVGGSLLARGGHNVLEPAHFGVPVFVGPHTDNFSEWVALLKNLGILRQVETPDLLEREWIDLFRHRERLDQWRGENQNKLTPLKGITQEHERLLGLTGLESQ